jgi:hypothetical protein
VTKKQGGFNKGDCQDRPGFQYGVLLAFNSCTTEIRDQRSGLRDQVSETRARQASGARKRGRDGRKRSRERILT